MHEKCMKIATDIDDLKAPFNGVFLPWVNHLKGTSFRMEDMKEFNYQHLLNLPENECMDLIYQFYDSDTFKSIRPYPEVVDLLHDLTNKKHELFCITGRGYEMMNATHAWLAHHFNGLYTQANTHFTNNFPREGFSAKVTKRDLCIKLGIQVLFEDNLQNSIECAEAGVYVFMPDRPWNRAIPVNRPERLIPIKTISEVYHHSLFKKEH